MRTAIATVTQFAQTSASSGTTQDGVAGGDRHRRSLQNGGMLVASYSNGRTQTLAQVAVASIGNPDTLIGQSNNNLHAGAMTR